MGPAENYCYWLANQLVSTNQAHKASCRTILLLTVSNSHANLKFTGGEVEAKDLCIGASENQVIAAN